MLSNPLHRKEVEELVLKYRWSYTFATEYVIARRFDGLSNERAFRKAMSSPYIRNSKKPKGDKSNVQKRKL